MSGTKQIRVLMFVENCSFPQDRRVRSEALALTAAGYQVTVISPAEVGQPRRETLQGVSVYRYRSPRAGNGILGYLWEYGFSLTASFFLSWKVLFREGFDIIHAHNPPDLFVLIAIFYKLSGKKFVFDHHDLSPEMYRARFRGGGNRLVFDVLVLFEKLSCRMADHVIATNHSYKNVQMERGNVSEERITVVRNGPDLDRVMLVEPDEELRRKATTILGYVGMMGFQDGLDYLLRALHHLVEDLDRKDVYCVAIGNGEAWESLLQLAADLNLQEYVWFPGHISDQDVLKYLSTADICVDPDPSNPFTDRSTMIKMMEYMALAKPIVAFDLPEHRASAQQAALYARATDELDFARQIAILIDDPDRRRRMSDFGRQRIETELAWSFQEKYLIGAYEKLLGSDHGSPPPEEPRNTMNVVKRESGTCATDGLN